MRFKLQCFCDIVLEVTAQQAGSVVRCACGRRVEVPPLSQLNAHHGGDPEAFVKELAEAEARQQHEEWHLPREVVMVLIPLPRCTTRIDQRSLNHFVHALEATVREFFAEPLLRYGRVD